MESKELAKWCRLCGVKSGSDVDVTLKINNTETLAEHIRKYFGIVISESHIGTKICKICDETINSIVQYHSHAHTVNEKYLELEKSYLNENPVEINPCKVTVVSNEIISFKRKPDDNSTTKQAEIDKAIKPPKKKSSVVFPFGLNDLDEVNLRCRYCNGKFYRKDCLIKHVESHFNYILTCHICKKHFSTKQKIQCHMTTHLTHVKSDSLNDSPSPDVKSYKVIEYNDCRFESELEDDSVKPSKESSSDVFPFGLKDLDKVNLRCRYCNRKFYKKDSLIQHTENHFNYTLTCNVCKKHFSTKQITRYHKTTHLNHVKSKINDSPPAVDVNPSKVIIISNEIVSFNSKPEDNSTTKQTEIDEVVTHLTDVKSKTLNNSPPPPCLSEIEMGDMTDVDLENLLSSSESNDDLPLAYVKSKTLNNSPPPVDVNPPKVIIISNEIVNFNYKPEDNSTTKQTEIDEVITHSTDVKSKTLNNSPPPPCLLEMEIGDVIDEDLENLLSSSESNDELPLAHLKSNTLNISPPSPCLLELEIGDVIDLSLIDSVSSSKPSECRMFKDEIQQQTNIKQGGDDNTNLNPEAGTSNENEIFKKKYFEKRYMGNYFETIVQNSVSPKCRVCGKTWKNMTNLRRHEAVHLPENERKSYECSYCKKKYKDKMWLTYHVRFVHKKDKSFMCTFCGVTFPTNMTLRCHMLIHSKKRKFECSKCEKSLQFLAFPKNLIQAN